MAKMTGQLAGHMTSEEFRRAGHELVDWIAGYWERLQRRDGALPVLSRVKPGEVAAMLPDAAPERGASWEEIFGDMERVVMPGITHWQSPGFFGFFSGADQDKPIGALSGGERSRARLAGLLASAKNLLILDEPTNHLDIPSAERLEDALALPDEEGDGMGYDGTLILVSHDRALIDATCDHLVVFDGAGSAEIFHGTYTEYHERQAARAAQQKAAEAEAQRRRESSQKKPAPAPAPRPQQPRSSLSWMTVERLEKEIAAITKRLKDLDAHMNEEEVYRDAAKCRRLLAERDDLQADLERHEEEWLRRSED